MPKLRLRSLGFIPSLWVVVEDIPGLNAVWELGWNPIHLIPSTYKQ